MGHGAGFWVVATVFLTTMAYSTVPTPLYPLYQQRDGFPVGMITVIFAAYAVGVMLSLYLAGHVSDWVGRRRMLVIAVLISMLSAVMFLAWSEVPGLIAARLVNGVSIGILSATATAHLAELRARARPGEGSVIATTVSGAANLGGLALGPLIGGLFAEFLPAPLVLPHIVFLALLAAEALALLSVPETVAATPRPYRPQRLSVPAASRSIFLVAGFGAFAGFAVFGLFSSLAPTFLVGTFGQDDHLLAGAAAFSVFAAAAVGQIALASVRQRTQFTIAIIACAVGLAGVASGAVIPQLTLFLGGGVIAGLGVGVLFKGAIGTAVAVAAAGRTGETLALLFLIAYAGLVVPVLAVGIGLTFAPAVGVLIVFVVLVLAATVSAAAIMRRRTA
ncbi:MFS transporter [Microbacterium pygmaeum]|uniref:Predicted arabinose efflux permease, MFS family n=1 Tax=Microbacterium pygmaeum TaxID=370764 RepID=A0A1G7TSR5_9MICO|nr:MFS transporter [Microbacterium pygmaeum]SDG38307.1 Predicted arabinose efflux permease, MFS family [Microbacterium pygmaeum]